MKFVYIILLFLCACGNYKKQGSSLGQVRTLNPVLVDEGEKTRIKTICTALLVKVQGFSQANTQTYLFSLAQKNCSISEGLSGAPGTDVTVVVDPGGVTFTRLDQGPFPYGVETSHSGLMGEICSNLDGLTSPKVSSSGGVLAFTTSSMSGADCQANGNEICILFEKGMKLNPNEFSTQTSQWTVQTREWMKFQIGPSLPNYGFFTERRTITSAGCATNESSQTLVRLK